MSQHWKPLCLTLQSFSCQINNGWDRQAINQRLLVQLDCFQDEPLLNQSSFKASKVDYIFTRSKAFMPKRLYPKKIIKVLAGTKYIASKLKACQILQGLQNNFFERRKVLRDTCRASAVGIIPNVIAKFHRAHRHTQKKLFAVFKTSKKSPLKILCR